MGHLDFDMAGYPFGISIIVEIPEGGGMDRPRAIAALGALAQETRLALFRLLVTVGPEGLPAGIIAERLSVVPSPLMFIYTSSCMPA